MSDRSFYASTYIEADGVSRIYPFSFAGVNAGQASGTKPYLYDEDVRVDELYTDAAGNKQTIARSGTLEVPNQITIAGPPVAKGREIHIYRQTELRFPLVDYRDLQSVSEHDLDLANRQAVFIAQETRDVASANLLADPHGNFDAKRRRVVNLAPGKDANDAVNMNQFWNTLRAPSQEGYLNTLPVASQRAGKLITFDAQGQPTVEYPANGSALDLEIRLAASGGSSKIGYERGEFAPVTNVETALNTRPLSIWEFSHLITERPSTNPAEWDWAPAIRGIVEAARATGLVNIVFPRGVYSTSPVYFIGGRYKDLHIDLCGSTLRCIGKRTMGTRYDWEYGVLTFHGEAVGGVQVTTVPAILPENTNAWTVTDSSQFKTGDYWIVEVDPDNDPDNGGDFSTKLVWRMLRVTAVNSATSVSFDYARVFDIPAGTKVKYTRVNPVENVTVSNVLIEYTLPFVAGSAVSQMEASSGVACYIASRCSVHNITYIRNPKQAVHFEFSHGCSATLVDMHDAVEVNSGGYTLQFEKSIYFTVDTCFAAKDRHLFDATASSNGRVTGCSGHNSTNSSFTTHGTYEHDISYTDNVGHLQFAGSGATFGETSSRMHVRNHVGSILNASAKVYDLTLEDCRFTSVANLNVDGLCLVRCTFLRDTRLTVRSTLSRRKSVATDTHFTAGAAFLNLPETGCIRMVRCTIPDMLDGALLGRGTLILDDCTVINSGASAAPLSVPLRALIVRRGQWEGMPILLDAESVQEIVFDGCTMHRLNRPAALALVATTKAAGTLDLVFAPRRSTTTGRHLTANNIGQSAATTIMLRDTELVGGSIQVQAPVVAAGWLSRSNVIYNGCVPIMPPASTRVGIGMELII